MQIPRRFSPKQFRTERSMASTAGTSANSSFASCTAILPSHHRTLMIDTPTSLEYHSIAAQNEVKVLQPCDNQ